MTNFRLVSVCLLSVIFQSTNSNNPYVIEYQQYNPILKEIFFNNSKTQDFLNTGNGARYGPTKFSHLSQEEFKRQYLSDLQRSPTKISEVKKKIWTNYPLPKKVDWRNRGGVNYVSPVKNQNECGGCWAFSTTETVESMYAIKYNVTPPRLSVQEVIDCSLNNYGCSGGNTCTALAWLNNSQSLLVYEEEYPLTDTSDYCKLLTNASRGVTIKDYTCESYVGKEETLLYLLAKKGPLVVSVDASTWNHYLGGIIQYHCGTTLNHAIQIVGYDLTGDVPFYIVRNSWGTDYGNGGYLYVKYGGNVCGIASDVSTVDVH
uniref:Cathepsin O-like n=1 Tax=Crassostrea virginica TaxID=6565 RepID=A0A8B8DGJ4_CRAVI|nr:cathepsin O-like [Crassostrea virginica]